MGKKFIHSTCGQPMVFNFGANDCGESKTPHPIDFTKKIRIGGGAWVITKDGNLPKVVITEVTDEELELLEAHPMFQRMKAKGFMSVHDVGYMEADSRGIPADHQKKDASSQILDEDHANGTDERLGHDGTLASYGEGNQWHGKQPIASENNEYGPIHIS